MKIYNDTKIKHFRDLLEFLARISPYQLPFQLPEIYEINSFEGVIYTIEKRLEGQTLKEISSSLTDKDKEIALSNYFNALRPLHRIQLDGYEFGQVLNKNSITAKSWQGFLHKKLQQRVSLSRLELVKDVNEFDTKLELMDKLLASKLGVVDKILVHGDYFYDNILMNSNLTVSAVLDFSENTFVGDPCLDITGVIIFLELDDIFPLKYIQWLRQIAVSGYGKKILELVRAYRLFYSFYLTDSHMYDRTLYTWCLENLNNERLWEQSTD